MSQDPSDETMELCARVLKEMAARLPSIPEILAAPTTSFWLKNAIQTSIMRDPVDAANDADTLMMLLNRRQDEMIARHLAARGF